METKKISCLLVGLVLSACLDAQDFHLSQYESAPLYLNPALTGMYVGDKGDFRLSNDYRSQWKSVSNTPFSTIYLAYDQPYQIKKKRIGLGAYLINERAGIGHFNTLSFMTSVAYNITEGSLKHYLTTGLQLGLFNKSFSPSAYTFDSQYSNGTGTFNTNLPNEENFSTENITRFDANMGIFYKYIAPEAKIHPFVGFSIYHLNLPKESFTGVGTRLPMRFALNMGCDIQADPSWKLTPSLLYMNQAGATELNLGMQAYYQLKGLFSLTGGLNYRYQDAVILNIGLKQEGHIFRLGYDINTSGLRTATGGRGAFELSLILIGYKGKGLFSGQSRF